MDRHIIKSERQSNGIWGTPLYLKSIDGNILFKDNNKSELLSAILISFAESKRENFTLNIDGDRFILKTDKSHFYSLDDFGLIDNTLYYLPTDDDKITFNRTLKLRKLSINKI